MHCKTRIVTNRKQCFRCLYSIDVKMVFRKINSNFHNFASTSWSYDLLWWEFIALKMLNFNLLENSFFSSNRSLALVRWPYRKYASNISNVQGPWIMVKIIHFRIYSLIRLTAEDFNAPELVYKWTVASSQAILRLPTYNIPSILPRQYHYLTVNFATEGILKAKMPAIMPVMFSENKLLTLHFSYVQLHLKKSSCIMLF